MELPLSLQLMRISSAFLVGLLLGAAYMLFSALRHGGKRRLSFICDALFTALFSLAIFLTGMGPGGGELRLYMPLLIFAGMAVFFFMFSDFFAPVLQALSRSIVKIASLRRRLRSAVCIHFKKFSETLKNLFSRTKKGVTIAENGAGCGRLRFKRRREPSEDKNLEAEKVKHIY